MVGLNGLEPSTSRLSGVRSNQLSYRPIWISLTLIMNMKELNLSKLNITDRSKFLKKLCCRLYTYLFVERTLFFHLSP